MGSVHPLRLHSPSAAVPAVCCPGNNAIKIMAADASAVTAPINSPFPHKRPVQISEPRCHVNTLRNHYAPEALCGHQSFRLSAEGKECALAAKGNVCAPRPEANRGAADSPLQQGGTPGPGGLRWVGARSPAQSWRGSEESKVSPGWIAGHSEGEAHEPVTCPPNGHVSITKWVLRVGRLLVLH